ncbi:hypothetical protein, partial [Nocardioides alcanivorans]|uniref:hypothetical protein n=1 Tax=Nocardioides alcanivorans TaxID=2897352 RepID=UPI001F37CD72
MEHALGGVVGRGVGDVGRDVGTRRVAQHRVGSEPPGEATDRHHGDRDHQHCRNDPLSAPTGAATGIGGEGMQREQARSDTRASWQSTRGNPRLTTDLAGRELDTHPTDQERPAAGQRGDHPAGRDRQSAARRHQRERGTDQENDADPCGCCLTGQAAEKQFVAVGHWHRRPASVSSPAVSCWAMPSGARQQEHGWKAR